MHARGGPLRFACAGIDYNPCMVAAGPVGAILVAEGIGINPQLITVGPSGAVLVALGALIVPATAEAHSASNAQSLGARVGGVAAPSCLGTSANLCPVGHPAAQ